MSDKFPPRVWVEKGSFVYRCVLRKEELKGWQNPTEYISVEEKDTIVSELERKLERASDALKIIFRGTHEEHPTCMLIDGKNFGPPRTGGWEGWAKEIDHLHRKIAGEALSEIEGTK